MKKMPKVSVVMGVHNEETTVCAAIDSIVNQDYPDLEILVVDDGSTDQTARLISDYCRKDPRIRMIQQEKMGLTRALIQGIEQSNGELIARQDAGDISSNNRISVQVGFLQNNPRYNVVSAGVNFYAPDNEFLFCPQIEENFLNKALVSTNPDALIGPPHHGAVMFRKSEYETAGGYRPQFYFAQDLDLWTRLALQGRHGVLNEVLYRALISPESISGLNSGSQLKLKNLIARGNKIRIDNGDEAKLLAQASQIRPGSNHSINNKQLADSHYFLGSMLSQHNPVSARKYFVNCLKLNRFHVKAAIKYCMSWY